MKGATSVGSRAEVRAAAPTSLTPPPDFLSARVATRQGPRNPLSEVPRKRRQPGARAWGRKGRMRGGRGHVREGRGCAGSEDGAESPVRRGGRRQRRRSGWRRSLAPALLARVSLRGAKSELQNCSQQLRNKFCVKRLRPLARLCPLLRNLEFAPT